MEKAITVCGHSRDKTDAINRYLDKGWVVKFPPVTFNDGEDVLVIVELPKTE